MNPTWINRIGIILNFLAAFLVAPELIGIERLDSFEKKIVTFLRENKTNIHNRYEVVLNILKIIKKEGFYKLIASSLSLLFTIIILLFIKNQEQDRKLIIIILIYWLIIPFLITIITSLISQEEIGILKRFLFLMSIITPSIIGIISPILTIINLIIIIYLLILFVLLKILSFIITQFLDKLREEKNLIKILVSLGILFLVIGNILQLIATF